MKNLQHSATWNLRELRAGIKVNYKNVAINDVLPLKAAWRDAIANLTCFLGPRDTSDLVSMVWFTFTMRRHLIRLAAAPFTSSRLAKFG